MKTFPVALSLIVALGLVTGGTDFACAQSYPQRPIKLVVPFPAGGSNDTAARIVAQGLSSTLGQPVIIENQSGAGGSIGAKQVATATPDGYTLLMAVPSNLFGTAPLLYRLDYIPLQAFVPWRCWQSTTSSWRSHHRCPPRTFKSSCNTPKRTPAS